MSASKAALRAELRGRLAAMSHGERERATARIAERVWSLPEMDAARTVLAYASLASEVGTDAILDAGWRRGMRVVLPRCGPTGNRMTLHGVSDMEQLSVGRFGIREPTGQCVEVHVGDIDVALVPGVGWDREGGRIGQGAGYYDRLLGNPSWKGVSLGLFFASQEVPRIPRDPWDASLDGIVTEREVVRP